MKYTNVKIRVTDSITDYDDESLDNDCTPFRLRKGTTATLLDTNGKKVVKIKAGKSKELDKEGSCGTTLKFGGFSSSSKAFTLSVGGLTLDYNADELPKPDVAALPDKWTKDEAAYLKAADSYADNKEEEGWAIADGYVACDDLRDYDDRRTQLEYLIEKGDFGLSDFKAAARTLCPKAKKLVDEAGRGFNDGNYDVGGEVKPGTYRSPKQTKDCYWSRTTAGGDIIANDLVGFAPAGVTVTIRASDGGFESERCSAWVRLY